MCVIFGIGTRWVIDRRQTSAIFADPVLDPVPFSASLRTFGIVLTIILKRKVHNSSFGKTKNLLPKIGSFTAQSTKIDIYFGVSIFGCETVSVR